MLYLITVKMPKNPDHNPRDKKTGPCPVNDKPCTDVTGEHHTFLVDFDDEVSVEDVREIYRGCDYWVTRVETV